MREDSGRAGKGVTDEEKLLRQPARDQGNDLEMNGGSKRQRMSILLIENKLTLTQLWCSSILASHD